MATVTVVVIAAAPVPLLYAVSAVRYRKALSVGIPGIFGCVCCGATSTTLIQVPETGQTVCEDRELCRQAMIYDNLLERVNPDEL